MKYAAILDGVAAPGHPVHVLAIAVLDPGQTIDASGYGHGAGRPAVDVTAVSPRPGPGWAWDGLAFAAPAPEPIPLPRQATLLLAGGLTIASAGRPGVNGTYPMTQEAQQYLQAEMISIIANSSFIGGEITLDWPDMGGTAHNFNISTFHAFANAAGAFVAGCVRVRQGRASELPDASVTLA